MRKDELTPTVCNLYGLLKVRQAPQDQGPRGRQDAAPAPGCGPGSAVAAPWGRPQEARHGSWQGSERPRLALGLAGPRSKDTEQPNSPAEPEHPGDSLYDCASLRRPTGDLRSYSAPRVRREQPAWLRRSDRQAEPRSALGVGDRRSQNHERSPLGRRAGLECSPARQPASVRTRQTVKGPPVRDRGYRSGFVAHRTGKRLTGSRYQNAEYPRYSRPNMRNLRYIHCAQLAGGKHGWAYL
jgi:hypothetical protein